MQDLWTYLQSTTKPIVLYGMGNGADKCIKYCEKFNIKLSGVFASDGFVRKKQFQGFEITDYKTKVCELGDMIVLVVFGSQLPEVISNIDKIASKQELYAPDMPLFGDNLFDLSFAKSHINELTEVYNMLEDKASKKAFEGVCRYKITGDISYLKNIETTHSEAVENILKFSNFETFLDLGAYKGDTVLEFVENVGGKYNKIYAVEPDAKTFKKLQASTNHLQNTHLFNACINDKTESVGFLTLGGRNSFASESGMQIQGITVDDLLGGESVSYIKFDVEGSEEKAIKGAKKTISQFKPKMLISAYHRSEDMFSLCLQVKKIRPDYKVYFRHYPYVPAWDSNFYFV